MLRLAILLVTALIPLVLCVVIVQRPICGPVCQIYCQYGNVLNAQGCQTCECNTPCGAGQTPLNSSYCGRGSDYRCPPSYQCVPAPDDSSAVCCPQIKLTTPPPIITKPGFCRKTRPGTVGICIANCTYDSNCDGNLKCCGGCLRICVKPFWP